MMNDAEKKSKMKEIAKALYNVSHDIDFVKCICLFLINDDEINGMYNYLKNSRFLSIPEIERYSLEVTAQRRKQL